MAIKLSTSTAAAHGSNKKLISSVAWGLAAVGMHTVDDIIELVGHKRKAMPGPDDDDGMPRTKKNEKHLRLQLS